MLYDRPAADGLHRYIKVAGHAMWLGNGGRFLFLVSEGEEKGHFPPRLATKTSFVVLSSLSSLTPRSLHGRRRLDRLNRGRMVKTIHVLLIVVPILGHLVKYMMGVFACIIIIDF